MRVYEKFQIREYKFTVLEKTIDCIEDIYKVRVRDTTLKETFYLTEPELEFQTPAGARLAILMFLEKESKK